ncbi:hypothetical protein DID88_002129 [Monilinia fructigena]|uniref:RING-type domain-containing protein n=1 Tax=Monilinia fructigena TaxID=38457 RepID=A0A395IVA8_9HELO|nr:hypothetical protein DID88_002129 [Monilinia fructigena]
MGADHNVGVADYCRHCFMLPDPRKSLLPGDKGRAPVAEWYAFDYQMVGTDSDMHDLLIRAQNLPLPAGPFQLNYFHLADKLVFDPLPRNILMKLERIVVRILLPHFWHRVLKGESPSNASRVACLRLRQIFMVNFAFQKARLNCTDDQWRRVLGYRDNALLPLQAPLGDLGECGICRVSLNEVDEEGLPVKTPCNHIFHLNCVTAWIIESAHGDCPSCRGGIRNMDPIMPIPRRGPSPNWFAVLTNEAENAEAENEPDYWDPELDGLIGLDFTGASPIDITFVRRHSWFLDPNNQKKKRKMFGGGILKKMQENFN